MYIDLNNIPETLTLKLRLTINKSGWVWQQEMTNWDDELNKLDDDETWLSDTVEVTFQTVDVTSVKNNLIKGLKEQKNKIRVAAEQECVEIEEKINSLLAIEYHGGNEK